MSHDYAKIYRNEKAYFDDLNLVKARVERITGTAPTIIRFPGGSSNTVSRRYDGGTHIMSLLTRRVEEEGYHYFDWNVASGDAGETTSVDDFREKMPKQIYSSVHWTQTIQKMVEEGVDTFIEIGPGKVLAGLNKKIAPEATVYNIFDKESLENTIDSLRENLVEV